MEGVLGQSANTNRQSNMSINSVRSSAGQILSSIIAEGEKSSVITDGTIIVVESPTYSQIAHGGPNVDRDDPDLYAILQETAGWLTVFSANVKPL